MYIFLFLKPWRKSDRTVTKIRESKKNVVTLIEKKAETKVKIIKALIRLAVSVFICCGS